MDVTKSALHALTATANQAQRRKEDSGATLDSSYREQLELLMKVRRGVADIRASREILESQVNVLRQEQSELQARAGQTPDALRLRRGTVRRKAAIDGELSRLAAKRALLLREEERLIAACGRLDVRVTAFRAKKEVIKASYAAAEILSSISEALSGVSGNPGNPGTHALSRQQGLEALSQVGRGMQELAECRERLEYEMNALSQRQAELDGEARRAMGCGREDLARQALAGKAAIGDDMSDLAEQLHSMRRDEEKVATAYKLLAAKVQA